MKRFFVILLSVLLLFSVLTGGCQIISVERNATAENVSTTTAPVETATTTQPAGTTPQTPGPTPVFNYGDDQALPSIADVVSKVKPSVVSINTEVVMRDFFNRPATQEGAGSGWIISPDGIIVTNNHVVENAQSITVVLDDGRSFNVNLASVIRDPVNDIAVLRIDAVNLPAVTLGDSSKMRVGDWVVALGNSLGEGVRATQGIISRRDASIKVDVGLSLYGLIETDAAINPGNSGGPLVNLAGEVIGVTNAKLEAVAVEATGYAISIATALPIIQGLLQNGRAVNPWLGVSLYTVDDLAIQTYNLTVEEGVLLVQVVGGSPAADAGLQANDVIISFAGQTVKTVDDIIKVLRTSQVGQDVAIVYVRGAQQFTATAKLIERPN